MRTIPMPWNPSAPDRLEQLDALVTRCRRLMEDGAVLTLHASPESTAAIAASALLVSMGSTAMHAVTAVASRVRGRPMSLDDEKIVWDYELKRDLQSEAEADIRSA
jgi:hypothetical protein